MLVEDMVAELKEKLQDDKVVWTSWWSRFIL
jgi:hypothetical protein